MAVGIYQLEAIPTKLQCLVALQQVESMALAFLTRAIPTPIPCLVVLRQVETKAGAFGTMAIPTPVQSLVVLQQVDRLATALPTYGDTNTTTISGTIKATGASSAALYNGYGSGNSFTLDEGAIIIGDILADDDATNSELIFNLGASTSYAYSVSGKGVGTGEGQWTISDLDGRTPVVTTGGTGCDTTITGANNTVCNLVTAVGVGFASNAEVQNELSHLNNSAVVNSLRGAKATHKDAEGNSAWVDLYTGSSKRTASTTDLTVSII